VLQAAIFDQFWTEPLGSETETVGKSSGGGVYNRFSEKIIAYQLNNFISARLRRWLSGRLKTTRLLVLAE